MDGRIQCRAEMCEIRAEINKPCWWCLKFGGSIYFQGVQASYDQVQLNNPTDIINWCFWFTQASLTEGN